MTQPAAATQPEPMIELRDVWKSFGEKSVLRGVSLEIAQSESFVIVGGSGTGKSVTLRHIIGLMEPDEGQVLIEGVDLNELGTVEKNRFRRRFGMSFQEGALFDSMTVFENIAFPLRRHTDRSEEEIAERVHECLEQVHLERVDQKRPSELSGGMRRRVGFARAISLEPAILLFDEPTTGLDPVISDIVAELIIEMDQQLGATAVTITHDMKVAFKIADRVAMLHKGHIVAVGTPEEFQACEDPLVRQFLEGRADGPFTD